MAEIIAAVSSMKELKALEDALRDPAITTRDMTKSDWSALAVRKAELQRGETRP